jgi:hypothetical protein
MTLRRRNHSALGLLLAGAGTLALVAGATSLQRHLMGGGSLVCDAPSHGFGAITREQAASCSHTFILRNPTAHPIRILKTTATCGCTTAALSNLIVKPNEQTSVAVKTDWQAKSGQQSSSVVVLTDAPVNPAVLLEVSGFVKVPAVLSPALINFGLLKPGEQAERVVEMTKGTDPRPFRLTGIANAIHNVSILRMNGDIADNTLPIEGGAGKFVVRISAPRAAGQEAGQVLFRTDLPDRPEIPLEIWAQYEGALVPTPSSLVFTDAAAETSQLALVARSTNGPMTAKPSAQISYARNISAKPFHVRHIQITNGAREAAIEVTFDRKAASQGLNSALLRIIVGQDTLDVPLMALATSRP